MAQRKESILKVREGPTRPSLSQSWASLIKRTALAPLRIMLSVSKSAARTITPPLMPLIALTAAAPFLLIMSVLVGFYVWRSGGVSWKTTLDLQYGSVSPMVPRGPVSISLPLTQFARSDGLPPYAEASLPIMSPVEPYDIVLHLTMPVTQANYDLGNFMTSLYLNSSKSKPLISVRKPVSRLVCSRSGVSRHIDDSPPTFRLYALQTKDG